MFTSASLVPLVVVWRGGAVLLRREALEPDSDTRVLVQPQFTLFNKVVVLCLEIKWEMLSCREIRHWF